MDHLSVSESLQVSLMVRPNLTTLSQQERKFKQQNQHRQHQVKQEDVEGGIGIVPMVLLVLALSSVEACMAFEHVYLLLILQYLGTPVSLMSMCGVMTGIISIITLPLLSCYANKGNDTWKRKWYTIIFGLAVFLTSFILLITAGIIKIIDVSNALNNVAKYYNSSATGFIRSENNSHSNVTSFEYNDVPITAILGIIGFGLADVGYDVSAPVIKSFVLDTLPTHQHTAVLATSTVLHGVGGTAITLISVFDLPSAIGSMFNVDGLAGAYLLLCGILCLAILITFSTTLITGYIVGGWMGKRGNGNPLSKNSVGIIGNEANGHKQSEYKYLSVTSTESLGLVSIDQHHTKEGSNEKIKDIHPTDSDEKQHLLPARHSESVKQRSTSSVYGGTSHLEKRRTNYKRTQTSTDPHLSTLNSNEPVSTTIVSSDKDPQTKNVYLKNKRVIITCLVGFFANGCLLSFSIYSPNALTIGIYKGDPLALPGLPGRELYEKGMRHAAFATLAVYISTFIFSACNHKMMKKIGEKPYYLIVCTIVASSITAFVGIQEVEAFFVTMVIFGSFRACCLTVPFVIMSRIVSEEILDNGPEDGKTMGGAILLLGMMMPSHYLILSSAMGPLIDATDNVWIPVIYADVVLLASAAALTLLYCVGHPRK